MAFFVLDIVILGSELSMTLTGSFHVVVFAIQIDSYEQSIWGVYP